jgi:hypothetical protein
MLDSVSGKSVSAIGNSSSDGFGVTWQYKAPNSVSPSLGVVGYYDNDFACPGFPNVTATSRVQVVCGGNDLVPTLKVANGDGACDFVLTLGVNSGWMMGCSVDPMAFFKACHAGPHDLSPLSSSSSPYFARGSDGNVYKLNVCGIVRDGSDCQMQNGMLCKYDATGNKFLGTLAQWTDGTDISWTYGVDHTGVFVVEGYTANGLSACDGTGRPQRVLWHFICGRLPSYAVSVDASGCLYTVTVASPIACPSS